MQSSKETSKFVKVLPVEEWMGIRTQHAERAAFLIDEYLRKRSEHKKQPVMDFLFEYYSFRPSFLRRWSPGAGVALEVNDLSKLPEVSELSIDGNLAWVEMSLFPEHRIKPARWILNMLKNTQQARPSFSCFGMHEWAMVYKQDTPRHNQLPMRMEPENLADFVESRPLLCTHYDAYRFFTPEAAPKNRYRPTRDNFELMEQPGCIHTNMDLYKWAYKLYPWVSGDIILEAFELALEARTMDMQASPYDMTGFGLKPIKVETEEGRVDYKKLQKSVFEKGKIVREKLIREYETFFRLLGTAE